MHLCREGGRSLEPNDGLGKTTLEPPGQQRRNRQHQQRKEQYNGLSARHLR
jgi:hypothetical protein